MLIENIEDVKNVINVSNLSTYEKLLNHLFNAEQKYIFPLIGSEMYDALADFKNNPDSNLLNRADMNTDFNDDFYTRVEEKSVAMARLLYTCQQAIAHLAFYEGFDLLNVFVSNSGFKRQEDDKTKSLFKYQEDNIRNYYKDHGLNILDNMLALLEQNITHFPEYNEAFSKNKGSIIPDTKTFHDIINIRNSRLVFLRLIAPMKTALELEITPLIGKQNVDFIIEELKKPSPAAKVMSVLPYLRNALAWAARVMLIEESGAEITERGLYFEGLKGGISMNDVKMPSDESRVGYLIKRDKNIAENYKQLLHQYLITNASDWNNYDNPRLRIHERDNSNKKTFWT